MKDEEIKKWGARYLAIRKILGSVGLIDARFIDVVAGTILEVEIWDAEPEAV